jgi:hypothetical protein
MKRLGLALALFGTVVGGSQKADAAAVVHTRYGTAVHTNYNWNAPYWRTHKYGYWNGQRGYWAVRNGRHVFVVVR